MNDINNDIVQEIRNIYTKSNPDFVKKKRMGFYIGGTAKKLYSWKIEEPFIYLPRGTVNDVEDLLRKNGYSLDFVRDKTLKFDRLNLKLKKQLFPYQQEAVNRLAIAGNAVIRGPCGCGKTIILIGAIAIIDQPTLIVVHTTGLLHQWKANINEWFGFVPGNIGGGQAINIRPITVGMHQTIWKHQNAPWIKNFGLIIGDEVHHWAAKTFQVTVSMFAAAYRLGASADERRKDGLEFMIYETFGPCVHTIEKQELIEINRLLPIYMEVVKTDYIDEDYIDSVKAKEVVDWTTFIDNLIANKERNGLIMKHVLRVLQKKRHRILMLSERVDHCKNWLHWLQDKGIPTGLMIGGLAYRRQFDTTIKGLKSGKIRVGVGTKVADEWLDIPPLTHVFVMCPVHTHVKRLEQMAGRTARIYGKRKKFGTMVYFWDHRIWPYERNTDTPRTRIKREREFLYRNLIPVCNEIEIIS